MSSLPPPTTRSQEFREALDQLRRDQSHAALPGLALIWLSIAALLLAPRAGLEPWHFALGFPLMGLLQYYLVISGHEAVHKTLCPTPWLNECLGVASQAMVGVNFAAYRIQHMDHHRVRSQREDPDGHIYGGILKAPAGWKRALTWSLGTLVELVIKIHQKGMGGIGNSEQHRPEIQRAKRRHSLYVVLCQLGLIALTWWSTGWFWAYALMWIGPLFTVAVFLNRSRILVEHGLALLLNQQQPPDQPGPRIPTVDIVPHPIERWIFAPFLFNHHCSHHLFMAVPHYHLPRLRALCREHQIPGFHEVRGSYLAAIWRALTHPVGPDLKAKLR